LYDAGAHHAIAEAIDALEIAQRRLTFDIQRAAPASVGPGRSYVYGRTHE
jgi:hypothetical protein